MVITKEEKKRQDELEKRVKAQQKRILKQWDTEAKRGDVALERRAESDVPLTGEEKLEEERWDKRSERTTSQASKWDDIWTRRQAKWDTRKRKFRS
ncbi:MAG: hypothetical protein ABIH55_01690 [Nanoarchaeota archaeon]